MSNQTRIIARNAAKSTNGPKPKPADRVSDDFIALLQNSQQELNAAIVNLQSARAAAQFVQRSMAAAYQLQDGDEVNVETGAITRASKPEPVKP